MFNIRSITRIDRADVALKHPATGAPLGAVVTLAGPEHPARLAIEFAKQRRVRASIQKSGKLELTDPAEDKAEVVDKLVACTLGWEGLGNDDGTPLVFSKEAAATLYGAEPMGWLVDQLWVALDERERFIVACATP